MSNLVPVEYKSQRVLTSKQLADGYDVEPLKITQNFGNNRDRYGYGIHYFILEGEELRQLRSDIENFDVAPNVNRIFLWTEKGALLHAKSLNTDKAWEVYGMLVDTYFRKQQPMTPQLLIASALIEAQKMLEQKDEQLQIMKPKAEFFDVVANSKDAIEIGQAAKVLNYGKGRNTLFAILREEKILRDNNEPYQDYIDRGYFRTIEQKYTKPGGETHISIKTLVYQKGLDYIKKVLDKRKAG